MSGREMSQRTAQSFVSLFALISFFALAIGCGESSDQPISAKTSKFEVDSTETNNKSVANNETDTPADAARKLAQAEPDAPTPPQKPLQPPMADNGQPRTKATANSVEEREPARPLSSAASAPKKVDPDNLPDGTPEELLSLIDDLDQRQPRGTNQQEMVADFRNLLLSRIRLAEKVLNAKATDEQRLDAAKRKLNALVQSAQLRLPNAPTDLMAFCKELSTDKAKGLARLGHTSLFQLELSSVASGDADAAKRTFDTLKQVLAEDGPQEDFFGPAQQSINALQQGQFSKEATEACRLVGETYLKSKNAKMAAIAKQIMEVARTLEADIPNKLLALRKGEPNAAEGVRDAVKKLLDGTPGPEILQAANESAHMLEATHQYKVAHEIYTTIATAFKDHADKEVAEQAVEAAEKGGLRLSLIGKPFAIDGNGLDGKPFDWAKYKGKVVLIDFWATWCGPCLQEIPNIRRNYEKYHEQGFEVVGVNMDDERAQLDEFFSVQALPWATVVTNDPKATGFNMPMAVKCGVTGIPFVILIGRDGKVLDIHVRGPELEERLATLFNGQKPADGGGALDKDQKSSRFEARPRGVLGLVGSEDVPLKNATNPTAANGKPAVVSKETPAKEGSKLANDNDKKETALSELEGNPYSPREDMTPAELIDFILNMQEKPRSIQSRAGFCEAIVEAADRVLAAKTTDKLQLIATLAKCETLHKRAAEGSEDADKQLFAFATSLKEDTRTKVVDEVRFLLLERRMLDAEKVPLDTLPDLLAELKTFCEKEKLTARHLRLASASVQAVNRIENGDEREKYFADLGGLFAKSRDKELARYGKKIAKKPAVSQSELVGKPLDLQGTTADGAAFDWKSYRGKVVLVDFWATWCGPCLREMPNVHKLHEKFKGKGFDVVGISVDADEEALADFLKQNHVPWTTLAGEEARALATKYGVRGIPTMMLIDRDGKVLGVGHRANDFAAQIEKLLEAKQ